MNAKRTETLKRGRSRGWAIRFIITMLLLPVGISTVELGLWATRGQAESRHDTVEAEFMPTRLKPRFRGRVGDLFFETNQFGFRSQLGLTLEGNDREMRVLTIGDSIGFGFGVPYEKHYGAVLENRLNAVSPRQVTVMNASGQGYSPSSYLAYLQHEGFAFQPDFILVQIELTNDVPDEALLRWASQEPLQVVGGRYRVSWDGNLLGTYSSGSFPIERTYLYTFGVRQILRTWHHLGLSRSPLDMSGQAYFHQDFERAALTSERIEEGWSRMLRALGTLQTWTTREQIPWAVLVIPPRIRFQPNAADYYEFATQVMARAEKELAARDIRVIWPTEELAKSGGANLYLDFAHLNPQGNAVVADVLARALETELRRE